MANYEEGKLGVLVGCISEEQVKNKEDKRIVKDFMDKHGYKYVNTKIVRRKKVEYLQIYVTNDIDKVAFF